MCCKFQELQVRPLKFEEYGDCQISRCPTQRSECPTQRSSFPTQRTRCPTQKSRCPTQGISTAYQYGGPHALSFDPTNTYSLLCAVNALKSVKEPRRYPIETSCPDSPRQSSSKSSNSSDSLITPSISAPIDPCLSHASGSVQSLPVSEPVQTCSSTSSSQNNSSQEMSQRSSSKGSAQVGAGTNSSESSENKGSEKKGLTWIEWGWPGTHDPCPFNQKHTVDDVLIRRDEWVGFLIPQECSRGTYP